MGPQTKESSVIKSHSINFTHKPPCAISFAKDGPDKTKMRAHTMSKRVHKIKKKEHKIKKRAHKLEKKEHKIKKREHTK